MNVESDLIAAQSQPPQLSSQEIELARGEFSIATCGLRLYHKER